MQYFKALYLAAVLFFSYPHIKAWSIEILASFWHDIGGIMWANHKRPEDEAALQPSMNMFSVGSIRTPRVDFTQKNKIRE
jgi:hypothetical protein